MPNLLHYFSNAPTPAITKVQSQYELLQSVYSTLSSADIIHLATTCREYWAYVASNKMTLTKLMSTAHCDGRGIVAQARVFGYWEGDPSKAPRSMQCLDADVEACTSCGAHVCDNCRFHFSYDERRNTGYPESDIAEDIEDEGMDFLTLRLPKSSIEGGKAFDMFWNYRRRTFCDAHEPLIIGLDNKFQTCHCRFYDHFVGNRWLCLPCFFVEEAKTYAIKERKIVGFEEGIPTALQRDGYIGVDICDCGQQSRPKSIEVCRVCDGVTGWYRDRANGMLEKIYAQLG